jgi:hypothetical protein
VSQVIGTCDSTYVRRVAFTRSRASPSPLLMAAGCRENDVTRPFPPGRRHAPHLTKPQSRSAGLNGLGPMNASRSGTSQTSDDVRRTTALTPKAGLPGSRRDVSQVPKAAVSKAARQTIYSITSSARASSVGGTSRPSALAVPTLMTSSNFVCCRTGRSAGFSPLRILPA